MLKTSFKFLLLTVALMALLPGQALAYLDPGTGNILIYIVVSLVGTVAFVLKGWGYKIAGLFKGRSARDKAAGGHDQLILFSEGKVHWYTFKPIIEALVKRGRPFTYLTMDREDPALALEHREMAARYIGEGSAAFARVCSVRAKVMLATTPNIGTPGYPLPKPIHVSCLVHVLHGIFGMDTYKKNALDHYDAVLLMADRFEKDVRKLEILRSLPTKECAGAGMPYLDELLPKAAEARERYRDQKSQSPTILVAPSWGEKSCLALCDELIIPQLLEAGYQVIFRPHPQSAQSDSAVLNSISKHFCGKDGFELDEELDSAPSMARADLLISDKSGVKLDFVFLYEKPVLTVHIPITDGDYEAADLGGTWADEAARLIGPVVEAADLKDVVPPVKEGLAWNLSDLTAFRESHVANFGTAGQAVADWLINKLEAPSGESSPDTPEKSD